MNIVCGEITIKPYLNIAIDKNKDIKENQFTNLFFA